MDNYCVSVCFPLQLHGAPYLLPSIYCVCVSGQFSFIDFKKSTILIMHMMLPVLKSQFSTPIHMHTCELPPPWWYPTEPQGSLQMPNTKHGLPGKLLFQLFIGHSGADKRMQGGKKTPFVCMRVRERGGGGRHQGYIYPVGFCPCLCMIFTSHVWHQNIQRASPPETVWRDPSVGIFSPLILITGRRDGLNLW